MMSAVASALLVLMGLCGLSVVSASLFDINPFSKWKISPPANCPHVNNQTHVCSILNATEGICRNIACCSSFGDDDFVSAYDEDMDGDNVYYFGRIDNYCPMCEAKRNCTLYSCQEKCCDGYQLVYGICQTTSEERWCDHGVFSSGFCVCDAGFIGYNCEIPQCNCFNGGECEVVNGKPTCICPEGYNGTKCEHLLCSLLCENGGTCMHVTGTGYFENYSVGEYCSCTENYIGTTCSIRHTNSPNCPMSTSNSTRNCVHLYGCAIYGCARDDEFCCKEGCSTFCRKRNPGTCYHNGQWFQKGEDYMIACNNCTCTADGHAACTEIECPPSSSRFLNCPRSIVTINVTATGKIQRLTEQSTNITAVYTNGRRAKVSFRHNTLRHCRCFRPSKQPFPVIAHAEGTTATCHFNVIVSDNMAPVITSCPEDVYVFENEPVKLPKPTFYDNVGIYKESKNKIYDKEYFKKGLYFAVYIITDFEGNVATCKVKVEVSKSDEDFDSLPLGHRRKSTGNKPSFVIMLGGIGGGVFIVIVGPMLAFAYCRCRSSNESTRARASLAPISDSARTSRAHRSVRFSPEIVYAVPSDIASLPPSSSARTSHAPISVISSPESILAVQSDVASLPPLTPYTLKAVVSAPLYTAVVSAPPYTPKAEVSAPPPYSTKSDMKNAVYQTLAPPSYQETVNYSESYTNPANS